MVYIGLVVLVCFVVVIFVLVIKYLLGFCGLGWIFIVVCVGNVYVMVIYYVVCLSLNMDKSFFFNLEIYLRVGLLIINLIVKNKKKVRIVSYF